ncbi:MAG: hypothetical protein BA869_10890 [Desulfuromonadales bacterium C00003107]|jgi:hypothetical protein|nr:MAG: hypothetical protein BA869_10890 [Desulfuromonadales bacterium C00003107]
MPQESPPINYKNFYRFPKSLIKDGRWASLPSASKTIFPVIAIYANAKGTAWPSQATIAKFAGCTPKTVREGIAGLKSLPGFNVKSTINSRGQRRYIYQVPVPPLGRGQDFRFYRVFIDGHNWGQLSPGAKAVYPVIRTFAYFDYLEDYLGVLADKGLLCNLEYGNFSDEEVKEMYEKRVFDWADPDLDVLEELSGLCSKTVNQALGQLSKMDLIEWDDNLKLWRCFLRPKWIYAAEQE